MRFLRRHTCVFISLVVLTACHTKKEIAHTKNNEEDTSSKNTITKYAALVGVPEEELRNKKLLLFIGDWYGVPYRYGGADKLGVDCSHLVCRVYKDVYEKF